MKEYICSAIAGLFLLISVVYVICEVEICTDGAQHVFQITQETCPFGVLFSEPQTADCLVITGEDEAAILADVCTKEAYSGDRKQFQFIPELSNEAIEPGNSCKTIMSTMCNKATQHIHKDSFLRRVTHANITFAPETNGSNKDSIRDQTQRLFEYSMGLSRVEIDESRRIVLLLKKSFEILKKFCSPHFLPTRFSEDVEAAFLFLLNEADATNVQDISYEEFERIMEHLVFCEDQRNPFKYEGKKWATYSMIQRVTKSGQIFSDFDTTNADAFMKYDVPVEATWGAIDFVHGLCYGTFRDHINSHHLYQQALERLFTKEILYRWQNRFVFQGRQHIWNNFFSANVKLALTNLDLCIQASYLSTPFHHRLERPFDGMAPSVSASSSASNSSQPTGDVPPEENLSRKKRWVETHALRTLDTVEGHCFQTREEADAVLANSCK